MTAVAQSTDLSTARRVIVKIGSTLLVDHERGTLHRHWLDGLAADLAACRERGQEIVIVSSGAIAVGRRYLGLADGGLKLEEMQAAAAAGMVRLAHAYQETLARFDLTVAQVLLTLDDSENRRRYLNARNTLDTLLRVGAVPLINENDTVATDEIRFGDNDRLAGRVAAMISADTLILLSDIDGLYAADPRDDPSARRLDVVREITPEIEAMAGDAKPGYGSGGMVTKLAAAKACLAAGCRMIIADGAGEHPIRRLEEGAPCTWFLPGATPKTARKRWIAGTLKPVGSIIIDAGAAKALRQGRSLLPAGVTVIEGTFQRGDAVVLRDEDGRELGRGLVAYAADDARRIIGRRSGDIEAVLGFRGRDEMIHRDDLVLG